MFWVFLKADHVFLSCLCDLHVVQLIRLKEGSECSSANLFHEDSAASLTLNEAKAQNTKQKQSNNMIVDCGVIVILEKVLQYFSNL